MRKKIFRLLIKQIIGFQAGAKKSSLKNKKNQEFKQTSMLKYVMLHMYSGI